ncbi:MAG TPA: hypothetical protein ENF57_03175 [Candidatus Korarchaeota archaeon]|nr:hypothetical protein [Candidatus Korarchaeota archaeon]
MRMFRGGLRSYLAKAELVQKLVLGWAASPALGLKMVSAYGEVAVDGERARRALEKKGLSEVSKILVSIPEGGDEEASLGSSLTLISQLLEADAQSRERWIYLAMTLGMALSVGVSLALTLGGVSLKFYHFLSLLLLYPIIPGLELGQLEHEPFLADAVASTLESGGGRVYALRHLGLYEKLLLDQPLHEAELPEWARVLLEISDRERLAVVMRRTSNMLKEFRRIISVWRAKMRSLKVMSLVITSALGISNVLLLRVINSPLLGMAILNPDLPVSLLVSGLVSVILSSKPVDVTLEASAVYLLSFSLAYSLIPQ